MNNRFQSTKPKGLQIPWRDFLTFRQQQDRLTLTISRGRIINEDAFRASFSFVIAIEPLISEPRGRGPRSGGGCLFQRRASRARDEERERDRRESSRLHVSQANVSTVLFLDASYWSRKAETGLCQQTGSKSPPAEGSLASPDASPGIATWRSQPCVRRCSFGALRLIPLFPTRSQPAHPNPGLLVFLTLHLGTCN